MDILQNISSGAYDIVTPFARKAKDPKAFEAYRNEAAKRLAQFKEDLFAEFGVSDNPKRELAFTLAWERGHAYGYMEVYNEFEDLVSLIDQAYALRVE